MVEPALERWRGQGNEYADAQLVFICHSMGGLVARWYIEQCGGAKFTRKLITLGTPYRGAARALEQLVNGVPKLGPFAIDLTALARSLPSLHQLLPEYACIEQGSELVKTTETTISKLSAAMVADAMAFHVTLREAEARRPQSLPMTHAILGTRQPTCTTARITADGHVVPLDTHQHDNWFGDSTVPLVGAARGDVDLGGHSLRRVADKHGNLQHNEAAFDEIREVLTGPVGTVKAAPGVPLQVDVPDLLVAPEPLPIRVVLPEGEQRAVRITVTDETGRLVEARTPKPSHGTVATTIEGLGPGAYAVDVTGLGVGTPVAAVSSTLLVWETERA